MSNPINYYNFPRPYKKISDNNDPIYTQESEVPFVNTAKPRAIQVQLQGITECVNSKEPIIFDVILNNQSSFILYDDTTGIITIKETGVFYINWWVSTDSIKGGEDTVITFGITSSLGDTIRASNTLGCGQMCGNALIEIIASQSNPVTLQLINYTDGMISFGVGPIKADLTIIKL